ncbi:hypothetical protein [Chitinophaga caseinilytica]|jgi:hypothetical protein|uniref:hypothetical protein n=1 Tax=Chitinophaga caseinilytica TaxID=2267521 RepID=UPI003C2D9736
MNLFHRFPYFWITAGVCFAGYWLIAIWMGEARWADTESVLQMGLGIAVIIQIFAWAVSARKPMQGPVAHPRDDAPQKKSTGK